MRNKDRRAHLRHDLETPAQLSVDQTDQSEGREDQRQHERISVAYAINFEAGLKVRGQEVMRLTLVGTTLDVSFGGMLIRVDQDVAPGARCDVRFLDSKGQIEPEETLGRVRRSTRSRNGFDLAVQFETPLRRLDTEVRQADDE